MSEKKIFITCLKCGRENFMPIWSDEDNGRHSIFSNTKNFKYKCTNPDCGHTDYVPLLKTLALDQHNHNKVLMDSKFSK